MTNTRILPIFAIDSCCCVLVIWADWDWLQDFERARINNSIPVRDVEPPLSGKTKTVIDVRWHDKGNCEADRFQLVSIWFM